MIKQDLIENLFGQREIINNRTIKVMLHCRNPDIDKMIKSLLLKYKTKIKEFDSEDDAMIEIFLIIWKAIDKLTFTSDEKEELRIWQLIQDNFWKPTNNTEAETYKKRLYGKIYADLKPLIQKLVVPKYINKRTTNNIHKTLHIGFWENLDDLSEEQNIFYQNQDYEPNELAKFFWDNYKKILTDEEIQVTELFKIYQNKYEVSRVLGKYRDYCHNKMMTIFDKTIREFLKIKGITKKTNKKTRVKLLNEYLKKPGFNPDEIEAQQKRNREYQDYLDKFIDTNTYRYDSHGNLIEVIPKKKNKKPDKLLYVLTTGIEINQEEKDILDERYNIKYNKKFSN